MADVGDDVYGDDPTVNKLEKLASKILGKDSALFVPSGTFGNQLALFTWCRRGTEVLLGEESHIIQNEAGAASIIAGVQTRPVPSPNGVISEKSLLDRLRKQNLHAPSTSLICLENAYGSRAVSLKAMDEVKKTADQWNIPVHLDGARIFNAAIALGCDVKDIAARADSVMICLSKGLCAPIGSILAGSRKFIQEARNKRKIMGGGMRQAGILCAAGIIALEGQSKKIFDDHIRAKKIAVELAKIPGISIKPKEVEINMIFFSWPPATNKKIADNIVKIFNKHKIIINPPDNNGLFRFVTHYWIGDKEVNDILDASREAFK